MSTNSISKFYEGANIFITGSTGFVGKVLLEKLLRSCNTGYIYLLMRPKKNLTTEQRLDELLKNPVFCKIREENPGRFQKVKLIYGDLLSENLGLSEDDRRMFVKQINVVFHSAASVRFRDGLQDILHLNVISTKQLLELSKLATKLKSFVYVSTAYSNVTDVSIKEAVYKLTNDLDFTIDCIKKLPADVAEGLRPVLIGDYPNIYLASKAMTESVVSQYENFFPLSIVRPSIISAAWKEPFPGWVDSRGGATGLTVGIYLGGITCVPVNGEYFIDLVPVDVTVNTLIAAGWYTSTFWPNTLQVYNCISGQINGITNQEYVDLLNKYSKMYPSKHLIRHHTAFTEHNKIVYAIYSFIYSYLPLFFADMYLYLTTGKTRMLRYYKAISEGFDDVDFAVLKKLIFHTAKFRNLIQSVSETEDGDDFDIDMSAGRTFCWDDYVKNYILGIRRHILKNDDPDVGHENAKLSRSD